MEWLGPANEPAYLRRQAADYRRLAARLEARALEMETAAGRRVPAARSGENAAASIADGGRGGKR